MLKYEKPPNWNDIIAHFPVEWGNVICTYGLDIYTSAPITHFKLIHEETHIKQQCQIGKEEWWKKYFDDKDFRFNQELEAYKNEVKEIIKVIKNRETRFMLIRDICKDLSSPMYGNLITYEEAVKILNQ